MRTAPTVRSVGEGCARRSERERPPATMTWGRSWSSIGGGQRAQEPGETDEGEADGAVRKSRGDEQPLVVDERPARGRYLAHSCRVRLMPRDEAWVKELSSHAPGSSDRAVTPQHLASVVLDTTTSLPPSRAAPLVAAVAAFTLGVGEELQRGPAKATGERTGSGSRLVTTRTRAMSAVKQPCPRPGTWSVRSNVSCASVTRARCARCARLGGGTIKQAPLRG